MEDIVLHLDAFQEPHTSLQQFSNTKSQVDSLMSNGDTTMEVDTILLNPAALSSLKRAQLMGLCKQYNLRAVGKVNQQMLSVHLQTNRINLFHPTHSRTLNL